MIKLNLDGCCAFADASQIKNYTFKALDAYDTLVSGKGAGCDFLGWKTLPCDISDELIASMEAVRDDWRALGVNLVVCIGIGGSYLGAKCALEALGNSFRFPDTRVVFAGNNLDSDYLAELMDLAQDSNVAIIVISKSGTTTEPAVAFRLMKEFVENKYGKAGAAARIVAVTDRSRGALKTLSDNEGYRTYVVPDDVGGRFSVLTPVGLLPIAVAGYDIRALLAGACGQMKQLTQRSESNPAVQYAAMRNLLYSSLGKSVEILVSYNPKLSFVAEWWKQLFGESEGKDGKGIFPASVTNTADLHSMGQFIQEGSRLMFETVLNVENAGRSIVIGSDPDNLDGLNFLAGKTVDNCNEMARQGTKLAHIDGGVPQIEISIEKLDEYNLGSLFYFFEFACGVSAYLLGVNPFNQPGVEAYKKNMFALLGKPGYESQAGELLKRL